MKHHGFAAGLFGLLSLFLFSTSTRAQPVPVIGQQPSSQSLVVGSNATFSVTATGQSPDYYWFFNGTNLVNGGRISGANSATLNITNITGADAGGYYVLVSNRHGTATSSTATLTVLFPPEISVQPVAQAVVIGNGASFSVVATGTAPLSYRWQRNGADLLDGGRIEGATAANLVITDVETTDAGNYSVIVSNAVGVMTSDAVALTVLVPPSIVQEPVSGSFVLGSSGSFSIEATGDAP
ncbi:MAG: immunoglobulin domain-containing protein, partial [Limisphaerales bacterium]